MQKWDFLNTEKCLTNYHWDGRVSQFTKKGIQVCNIWYYMIWYDIRWYDCGFINNIKSISKKVSISSSKKSLKNGFEIHYVKLALCLILLLCIGLNVTRTKQKYLIDKTFEMKMLHILLKVKKNVSFLILRMKYLFYFGTKNRLILKRIVNNATWKRVREFVIDCSF